MVNALLVLRKQAGMTQAELGVLVDLYQSEVSSIERGKRMRNLDNVAAYFNVRNPDDLLLDWDTFRERNPGYRNPRAELVGV